MLVYRIFPYLDTAAPGQPGHPLYEHHPQNGGRIDHPDYYVWYTSTTAAGAVGETFGNLARWTDDMIDFPSLPGARRVLGTFQMKDDLRILDLDDPNTLAERGLRPTQIVARNTSVTRRWAHDIWSEPDPHGGRAWDAVQWWSFHRPQWTILASWERPLDIVDITELSLAHPAVVDAAATLCRQL